MIPEYYRAFAPTFISFFFFVKAESKDHKKTKPTTQKLDFMKESTTSNYPCSHRHRRHRHPSISSISTSRYTSLLPLFFALVLLSGALVLAAKNTAAPTKSQQTHAFTHTSTTPYPSTLHEPTQNSLLKSILNSAVSFVHHYWNSLYSLDVSSLATLFGAPFFDSWNNKLAQQDLDCIPCPVYSTTPTSTQNHYIDNMAGRGNAPVSLLFGGKGMEVGGLCSALLLSSPLLCLSIFIYSKTLTILHCKQSN